MRHPEASSDPDEDAPVIARGARFEGVLAFRGQTRIEGFLSGRVVGRGSLLVGPDAEVHGPIEVDELVVAGTVEGPVEARRRLALLPTGRVVGDVQSPRLSMGDGARLEGRCVTRPAANHPENLPVSPSRSS